MFERIDKHFNEESKNLSAELTKHKDHLATELQQLKSQFDEISKIDRSSFYTEFHAEVDGVKKEFEELWHEIKSHKENLSSLLQKRIEDIFNNSTSFVGNISEK